MYPYLKLCTILGSLVRFSPIHNFRYFSYILTAYIFNSEKPNATIGCGSPVFLNESGNFSCECKNEGGVYLPNVTWYKNNQIVNRSVGESTLSLTDVDSKQNNKTYKCVVQRYDLKDEKSIDLFVYRKYMHVELTKNVCFGYVRPVICVLAQPVGLRYTMC